MPAVSRQQLNPSSIAGMDYMIPDSDPGLVEFPSYKKHEDVVDNEIENVLYIHVMGLERPDREVEHSVVNLLKRDVLMALSIFIDKSRSYHFSDFRPGMSCFISTLSGLFIYFQK